jgi:hypothetical protein
MRKKIGSPVAMVASTAILLLGGIAVSSDSAFASTRTGVCVSASMRTDSAPGCKMEDRCGFTLQDGWKCHKEKVCPEKPRNCPNPWDFGCRWGPKPSPSD